MEPLSQTSEFHQVPPKEFSTSCMDVTPSEVVEDPRPPKDIAHFAQSSSAILANEYEMNHHQSSSSTPPLYSQTTMDIPATISNHSQDILTPWSCKGTKIFVDICSGDSRPLSAAIEALGLPALSIDILLDSRMDLLDDQFLEQLLRLCGSGIVGYTGASPSCTEYSLLKLRPGGPKALRTPNQLQGVPNLTQEEQLRLQESATMLDRCWGAWTFGTTFRSNELEGILNPTMATSIAMCAHPSGSLCFWMEHQKDMVVRIIISSVIGHCCSLSTSSEHSSINCRCSR